METRNQTHSEFRQATQDALNRHDAQFQTLFTELQAIQTALQTLTTRVVNNNDSTSGTNSRIHGGGGVSHADGRSYLKLQFPRFGGEDPTGWIYQAEQYFAFQRVAAEDQVQLASFHLDGIALQWHRWITRFRGPLTWVEFSQAILNRFGPTDYEDPSEALTRLSQSTSVAHYQQLFETLSNRVDDLPESFLIGCFIGGLKDEIRLEVKLKTPRHLSDAIGMARLVEEKLNLQRESCPSPTPLQTVAAAQSTHRDGILGPGPTHRLALPDPNPIRRLSNVEAKQRRDKGLCYYCDEIYVPGHKCSKPQLFMISDFLETKDDNRIPEAGGSAWEVSTADGAPNQVGWKT